MPTDLHAYQLRYASATHIPYSRPAQIVKLQLSHTGQFAGILPRRTEVDDLLSFASS